MQLVVQTLSFVVVPLTLLEQDRQVSKDRDIRRGPLVDSNYLWGRICKSTRAIELETCLSSNTQVVHVPTNCLVAVPIPSCL